MKSGVVASLIDRRADMAACLTNNIRRDIRDCLRKYGTLTIHDISKHLGIPEPKLYYHLDLMVKSGIVVKKLSRIKGRLVAEYSLSEEYNRLFSEQPTVPDLTPIYALLGTYVSFIILSLTFGSWLVQFLKPFGIITVSQLLTVGIVGLISTLIPIIYYTIRFHSNLVNCLKTIRSKLVHLKIVRRW